MPIYEYVCKECNEDFDLLVFKSAEADNQACPHCGSTNLVRKMSAFARPGGGSSCGSCSSKSSSCGST
jgi:putative FmdB family regulatory protein